MKKKIVLAVAMVLVLSICSVAMVALASPPDVTTVMETSFKSIVNDILEIIAIVLPIALGVLGMTMAIRFGIKWFKNLTKG